MKPKDAVSHIEFAKAWQAAESVEELAKQLGMTAASVTARAFRMRRRGVALKHMQRRCGANASYDVAALNAAIGAK